MEYFLFVFFGPFNSSTPFNPLSMNLSVSLILLFVCLVFYASPSLSKQTPEKLLWPLPVQYSIDATTVYEIPAKNFTLTSPSANPVLLKAFDRYYRLMFNTGNAKNTRIPRSKISYDSSSERDAQLPTVTGLVVYLTNSQLQKIDLGVDERYNLTISSPTVIIYAQNAFGAIRGLETFSQLVFNNNSGFITWKTNITDYPRFPWRGLLIDSSRHYLEKDVIFQTIEALSFTKMNVLHWHMSDGQSIPYDSRVWPELKKGAYSSRHVYTLETIREVIDFANDHAVRVVVEFDMPSHAGPAFGKGYPFLTMNCSNINPYCKTDLYEYSDHCSDFPFDPTNPQVYSWLSTFLDEVTSVFTDSHLHMGGDEVAVSCWVEKRIIQWMEANGVSNFHNLEQYFLTNVQQMALKNNKTIVNWEEVYTSGFTFPKNTIIEVWKDKQTLYRAASEKINTILAYDWYLDNLSATWKDFYLNEIYDNSSMTPGMEQFILGGEACMWGETVDSANIHGRVWPRCAATAERLWSPESYTDTKTAQPRLINMRCRMLVRGIPGSPIFPGPESLCLIG